MPSSIKRPAALAALSLALALGAPAGAAPSHLPATGSVLSWKPLLKTLWIPRTTAAAYKLHYVSTDAFGKPAVTTGTVFLPKGTPPPGGWPVISWAHGTSGLGDTCAPSSFGPAEPARDWAYLSTWMRQGYAIVASDYAGLGTPGLHPYLDGAVAAHNVVDMVLAGRAFAKAHLPASEQLASKWVTIGQSQGAGVSIYTARYATQYGGPTLHYKGAVGTGTPAYIELYLQPLGPETPPVNLPAGTTEYLTYIFAALRYVHPELGIDKILTPTGRYWLKQAETECADQFDAELQGVRVGDFFTQPVSTLPNFTATVRAYLGMPESGYDKPFFMGHGLIDQDVPIPATVAYVGVLNANHQPVTFKTYPGDHNSTMAMSLADSVPFVKKLFAS